MLIACCLLLCVDVFPTGSSLSDQVDQNPADMYKKPGEKAQVNCSHNIPSYNTILWYRQQLPGEGMKQIVFTIPDYEPGFNEEKFPVTKPDAVSGTLTVKDLVAEDKALYFCLSAPQ
uniref:Ig-like domain-containing protein n=1 Tax=Myripristis murdjan TaxID=586833 RepID=A0A667YKX9_9TELE